MNQRRSRRLEPDVRPLVPDFSAVPPITAELKSLRTEVERLRTELKGLRVVLALERRRHGKIESAFAKYQGVLEVQLTTQREAVELLGRELKPSGRQQ